MQRTDATARHGSERSIPDTTIPKMAKTTIRLQLLAKAGELYHILSVMVRGNNATTRLKTRIMIAVLWKVLGRTPSVDLTNGTQNHSVMSVNVILRQEGSRATESLVFAKP
jgi:hypothetical protein